MEEQSVKVLQVLGTLNCGGAENFVMNLYRNIDKSKVKFDFVIHTDQECFFSEEVRKLGGTIYHAPRYRVYNHLQYVAWWKQFLRQQPYDVVHGHMYSVASIYLKVATRLGIKTISHSHNSSNGMGISAQIKNLMQHGIGKVANYKLACGTDAGKWLYGKDSDFVVIHNGIETEKYQYDEVIRHKYREELQLEQHFVVGHVGRFDEVKNHAFLLQVFREITKLNPQSKLLLVGTGPLKEEIQNQAIQLGIDSNIVFTGIRSDVNQLMMAMDVFCMPSIHEGLPVVLIEAQASGLCSVVSDTIDHNANITQTMQFLSLNKDPSIWAKDLISTKMHPNRELCSDQINALGYGITNAVTYLEKLYRG